mgnify:CR=1 FL=1
MFVGLAEYAPARHSAVDTDVSLDLMERELQSLDLLKLALVSGVDLNRFVSGDIHASLESLLGHDPLVMSLEELSEAVEEKATEAKKVFWTKKKKVILGVLAGTLAISAAIALSLKKGKEALKMDLSHTEEKLKAEQNSPKTSSKLDVSDPFTWRYHQGKDADLMSSVYHIHDTALAIRDIAQHDLSNDDFRFIERLKISGNSARSGGFEVYTNGTNEIIAEAAKRLRGLEKNATNPIEIKNLAKLSERLSTEANKLKTLVDKHLVTVAPPPKA